MTSSDSDGGIDIPPTLARAVRAPSLVGVVDPAPYAVPLREEFGDPAQIA